MPPLHEYPSPSRHDGVNDVLHPLFFGRYSFLLYRTRIRGIDRAIDVSSFIPILVRQNSSELHPHLRVGELPALVFVKRKGLHTLFELGNTVVVDILEIQLTILAQHGDLVAIALVERYSPAQEKLGLEPKLVKGSGRLDIREVSLEILGASADEGSHGAGLRRCWHHVDVEVDLADLQDVLDDEVFAVLLRVADGHGTHLGISVLVEVCLEVVTGPEPNSVSGVVHRGFDLARAIGCVVRVGGDEDVVWSGIVRRFNAQHHPVRSGHQEPSGEEPVFGTLNSIH
mmetsp:Transcript_36858/g.68044  ORF Transcript_36858/g.68044 Transcript_36858/m.68044 type:complete len:285 (-) Transcript_36858:184-1038(-)